MPDIQVMGVADSQPYAERIVGNLRLAGFSQEAISVIRVTHEESEQIDQVADQSGEGASEVAQSATVGAAIGGSTGVVAGLAALAIPGLGPVIGTGILLGLFGGSGAVVGALSGAFASETVSEQVIERYGMALREGQTVISVTAADADQAKLAEETMNTSGAVNINSYMEDVTDITDTPGVTDVSEGT